MDATAARSIDAVRRFFRAYLRERNPEKTAHCLCEDVRWIARNSSRSSARNASRPSPMVPDAPMPIQRADNAARAEKADFAK